MPGPQSGPGTYAGAGTTGESAGMVRHEERLHISLARTAVETVRFTRRVVTETKMIPVRVRREILEIEHITLAPEKDTVQVGVDETSPQQDDLVIVLREEVPVVSVRQQATERVRIRVRRVASETPVTADLRSERVVVERLPVAETG